DLSFFAEYASARSPACTAMRMSFSAAGKSQSRPRKRNDPLKLRDRFFTQLAARATDFRKLVFPGERSHGVEDRPAVGVVLVISFLRRHARIERRTPTAVDDIDIGRRIDAGHHRPEYFLHVGWIDVFVHHDDVAAVTIGRGVSERRGTRLLGMS